VGELDAKGKKGRVKVLDWKERPALAQGQRTRAFRETKREGGSVGGKRGGRPFPKVGAQAGPETSQQVPVRRDAGPGTSAEGGKGDATYLWTKQARKDIAQIKGGPLKISQEERIREGKRLRAPPVTFGRERGGGSQNPHKQKRGNV